MVAAVLQINAEFPRKLDFLLERPARFKVAYGGRGGAKSWGMARALLLRGIREPGLRVLCTREVQSSIKESVHQLLKDQIKAMGLESFYRVLDNEIRGPGNTLFIFKGLSDPEALKSAEGCDVCWIEEARVLTESAFRKLTPTVRRPGSEIWLSFNPELENDFVYKHFVKGEPPRNSIVVKINWYDNPWFPQVLREEKDELKEKDYDTYLWVWEGACLAALEGAVYAKELRAATKDGRICRFQHIKSKIVLTFWDLGRSDLTAIWFVQLFGLENRVVRYYANNGEHISHYTDLMKKLEREEGYVFGTCWLPSDADEKRLQSKRTTRQQIEDAGFKCKIVPKVSVTDGINAARAIFPYTYFHEEHAGDGVDALRQYHYDVKDVPGKGEVRSKNPVHDWSSNGADAFRYMGVALREEKPKDKPKAVPRSNVRPSPQGWMRR